jgi:hypothetical protein
MARDKKIDTDTSSVARREKKRPGSKLGVKRGPYKQTGHLQTLAHGLYFRPDKFEIDHRSALGRALKDIVTSLLDRFPAQAPAMAQLLAQRCAYKLVRAASYETFVLTGKEAPALSADQDYLRLAGSIRADIQTLYLMAKDSAMVDQAPDLKEYLAMLKAAAKATPIIHKVANDNPEDQ